MGLETGEEGRQVMDRRPVSPLRDTITMGLGAAAASLAAGAVLGQTDSPEAAQAAGQAAQLVTAALIGGLVGILGGGFNWIRNKLSGKPAGKARTVLLGE